MPLAVGLIVDALTPVRDDSFHRILWIAGGYLLLLVKNPLFQTVIARMMNGLLRRMQFNLRRALVEQLRQLALTFHEANQSSALQTKILRDVDAIDSLCRYLMLNGMNGLLVIVYVTVIALVTQPLLALYFLLTVPAGIALLKLFDRRFREQYQTLRVEPKQMNARVTEMLLMLPVTRHKISVDDAVMFNTHFGMLIGAVQQTLGVFPARAQGRDAIRSIGEILEAPQVENYDGKPSAP